MNIITENLQADGGQVLWDGKSIQEWGAEYRAILGYAPQQQGLYDTFTGRRFLSYMGALKEISKNRIKSEIEESAAYVNLLEKLDRPGLVPLFWRHEAAASDCPGNDGQAKINCFDEPTAGLDPQGTSQYSRKN